MDIAIFTGRCTKDTELREVTVTGAHGPEKVKVATVNIACNTIGYNAKNKPAKYVQFTLWRGQAEALVPYLKQGKRVTVVGNVAARAYTTKDGKPGASLELDHTLGLELLDDARGTAGAQEPPEIELSELAGVVSFAG